MFGGNIPFANEAVSFVDREMSLVAKSGDIDLLAAIGPPVPCRSSGHGYPFVWPCADYRAKSHVLNMAIHPASRIAGSKAYIQIVNRLVRRSRKAQSIRCQDPEAHEKQTVVDQKLRAIIITGL